MTDSKNVLFSVLLMPFLAACASDNAAEREGGAKREGQCPPGRTMMCEERVGQTQNCKCLSNTDMEDIYDLRPERY